MLRGHFSKSRVLALENTRPRELPPEPCARRRRTTSARTATCRGPRTPRSRSAPGSLYRASPPRSGDPGCPPSQDPCTEPVSLASSLLPPSTCTKFTCPVAISPIVCLNCCYRKGLYQSALGRQSKQISDGCGLAAGG